MDVILSCICPISVASVGWYPTAEGIRPSNAETSDPAWVKRNILSMKKSMSLGPSFPLLSLNDSARVRPDRATEERAPGGSFIWPNTMATCDLGSSSWSTLERSQCPSSILLRNSSPYLMTPDSIISRRRSLPSRVRSPTPANTENPLCFLAILLISSLIRTVFPTPAPPNSPIFPPFR